MRNKHSSIRKSDLMGGVKCPHCGGAGIVDFVDLVRGVSSLHCDPCGAAWKMKIQASMGHLAS